MCRHRGEQQSIIYLHSLRAVSFCFDKLKLKQPVVRSLNQLPLYHSEPRTRQSHHNNPSTSHTRMRLLLHVKTRRAIGGGIARKVPCRAKDEYETFDKEKQHATKPKYTKPKYRIMISQNETRPLGTQTKTCNKAEDRR